MKYCITDRRLGWNVREAALAGVDYIQVREKDLPARALLQLTQGAVADVRGTSARVLVNDRGDVALAAGAAGVHLRGGWPPVRLWRRWPLVIAVSCHSLEDVVCAEADGADFAVYGPVFASPGKGPAVGLAALERVCRAVRIPVFALGGITWENESSCYAAGAAGISAIRMFLEPKSG